MNTKEMNLLDTMAEKIKEAIEEFERLTDGSGYLEHLEVTDDRGGDGYLLFKVKTLPASGNPETVSLAV